MTTFEKFLKDEDGAVTIEWVALAAGVVLLALGVIAVLNPALESVATNIASTITNSTNAFSDAAGTETTNTTSG
ncbi:MAG: hypothetical protein RQ752_13720 [Thermohalobaculum sp.]|nr:hypothetical protein [Thermohalobaculum sp.]